jgi:Lon protease-like protein
VATLPMFPLGTVLFPGAVLALRVFEPRYRALLADCITGEPEFGVVLIERGSEVGGGDTRASVGTVAAIVDLMALPGGRFAVRAVGTRRIRVERWLPDDPYPKADVIDYPDATEEPPGPSVDEVAAQLRRVLALQTELGQGNAPATTELTPEPLMASYHAAALAPLGPADRYTLLGVPGPQQRLALLLRLLADQEELLRFRLA